MTLLRPVPRSVWRSGPGGMVAEVAPVAGSRVVVWAVGWGAEAVAARVGEVPFVALRRAAYCVVEGRGVLRFVAPRVPESCVVMAAAEVPVALSFGWPRALLARGVTAPRLAEVEAALAAANLPRALDVLGRMLLAEGREREAAARAVLAWLARHPLMREPALGALAAALAA